jgi:2-alkyl-3-oxoalkanoate reductase
MRVLVTGANGFLGSAVVRRAVEAGHEVTALVRPTADLDGVDWASAPVEVVRGDLRASIEPGRFADIDAVIHVAAATDGDLAAQLAGSVVGTERLLDHLDLARLQRFVHVSSFSVYDFASTPRGGLISPTTQLEPHPERRDAYTVAKLAQERLVRSRCALAGTPLVVLRPGLIFGPGKDWDWGRAARIGSCDVVLAPRARMPLTYVDNCADAFVAALEAPDAGGATLDVVDDDLPTHAGYRRLARRAGASIPRARLPVPWSVVTLLGAVIDRADARFAHHRAKLPELLSWPRQQARWKPLEYSNDQTKRVLGWSPQVPMGEAVARTVRKDAA